MFGGHFLTDGRAICQPNCVGFVLNPCRNRADNQGMVIPLRILTLVIGATALAAAGMMLLLVAAR